MKNTIFQQIKDYLWEVEFQKELDKLRKDGQLTENQSKWYELAQENFDNAKTIEGLEAFVLMYFEEGSLNSRFFAHNLIKKIIEEK